MRIGGTIVRALVAIPFIYDGLDATINAGKHAQLAQRHFSLFERLGVPPLQLTDLKTLSRVSGIATVVAAWRLLGGKNVRLAVCFLTGINATAAAIHAWQTNPGQRATLEGSRISAAVGIQAGLFSLLRKPRS